MDRAQKYKEGIRLIAEAAVEEAEVVVKSSMDEIGEETTKENVLEYAEMMISEGDINNSIVNDVMEKMREIIFPEANGVEPDLTV